MTPQTIDERRDAVLRACRESALDLVQQIRETGLPIVTKRDGATYYLGADELEARIRAWDEEHGIPAPVLFPPPAGGAAPAARTA